MSNREDIEKIRRWAREVAEYRDMDGIAAAVRRLFLGDGDPLIKFAGSDLAELRRELDEAPMSSPQRVRVNRRLDLLQRAMETEEENAKTKELERYIEQREATWQAAKTAIETLTEYLGGIDARCHNYQAAANHAVRICRGMLRIAGTIPRRNESKDTWDDVIEQAVLGLSKLKDHRFIIETKERWQEDDAEGKRIAGARQRTVSFLRGLLKPACQNDPLLTRAFGDVINLLDHIAGEDIPF